MNPSPASITKDQVKYIHVLAGKDNLNWTREQYKQRLDDAWNVRSCLELTSGKAAKVIRWMKDIIRADKPAYISAKTDIDRRDAWRKEIFTTGALRGLALSENGTPPFKSSIDKVSDWLLEITFKVKADDPAGWARNFINCTIRKPMISTQVQAELVQAACLKKFRQIKAQKAKKATKKKYKLNNKKME